MKSLNVPYSPALDHIRTLAASIVFVFHFYLLYYQAGGGKLEQSGWGIVTEGHTGVALFFTLSGFLFMRIAYHQPVASYRDFLRNRFLRIFPLYLTIFFLALSISRDTFEPQDILYLLFSNIGHAPTSDTAITGAAWTISIELTFYLVFPFLSRMVAAQGPRYLFKLMAILLLFKLSAYSVNPRSTHMLFCTLVGRFDQFLIGMFGAWLVHEHHAWLQRRAKWLFPFAALLVLMNSAIQAHFGPLASPVEKNPFWITWSMQEGAAWMLFIVTWVCADFPLPGWLSRLLARGGEISFSFYMLHYMLIHLVTTYAGFQRLTGVYALDALLMCVALYVAAWLIAGVSFATIEQPFLRLRRSYGSGVQH